ncbi:adhesion G-protein coupled receptor F1-like [Anableps anableps]
MSPDSPRSIILDYITYIGVGISMACLVICLIIEAIIWRKINKNPTSYLRHVSIVNIAVSLLIANIWFIIGAAISDADKKNPPACTAATFFIHFFYLALFFWMFASALLLFYRTVSVFDGGLSKISMLIIGFSLGYGAPLIIATITIAATAPSNQYIRENVVCWLNWYESKALLAFVIPALMIVVINFIILIVVLYKILRRRVGGNAAQAGEKHVLYVIARSLAVLTPFFGLTWGLGVGTMVDPKNFGIHVAFAFFNSLQGFFILVFGTLLDKKITDITGKNTEHQCWNIIWWTEQLVPENENGQRILWGVLKEYGVPGLLIQAVKSLYDWCQSLVCIVGNDVVLLSSSGHDLQLLLEQFAAKCEAARMKISASKSETIVLCRKRVAYLLWVGEEVLPQVEKFRYLGVLFTNEGKIKREMDRRIGAASAVMRALC